MSWTELHARLHQTLRERALLTKTQRLLVAVSGGQDSLCLGKLLIDLQPKWHWQLAIAHCDHGWSSDAGIADHVQHIAQVWQVPYYCKIGQVAQTEAAAREWRYKSLVEIAQAHGFVTVVTGHTQSDRAETLLYNLIRGSGTDGLQALTWKRPLTSEIDLVRPLLNVSRAQTLQFCQQFELPIWSDAANQNLHYVRNRIRTQLLPSLQRFNPQVETALAQTAELLRADVEYLETAAQKLLEQAFTSKQLDRTCLASAPLALQRRAIRQILQQILNKAPGFAEIEAITRLIDAPNRTRTSSLPGGAIAEVQGKWIVFFGTD